MAYPVKFPTRPPRPNRGRDGYMVRPGYYARTPENHDGRHRAQDIDTPNAGKRLWVKAVRAGRVSFAGTYGKLGKAVAVVDKWDREWWFCHLSEITVKVGQRVRRRGKRSRLGKEGTTGNSSGDHLHVVLLAEPLGGRPWGSVPFLDPYPEILAEWKREWGRS